MRERGEKGKAGGVGVEQEKNQGESFLSRGQEAGEGEREEEAEERRMLLERVESGGTDGGRIG